MKQIRMIYSDFDFEHYKNNICTYKKTNVCISINFRRTRWPWVYLDYTDFHEKKISVSLSMYSISFTRDKGGYDNLKSLYIPLNDA